jgi:hypothetical protein
MNIITYQAQFDALVNGTNAPAPYNDAAYMEYTKLNAARYKRWMKTGEITSENKHILSGIQQAMQWILITEHWCGDAAHIVPIIGLMAATNTLIDLKIELRDTPPFLIDQYLTNGGKSIPILIVRNAQNKDILVWGPRPSGAQTLFNELKAAEASFEEVKVKLQNWYNDDKGLQIQNEITQALKAAL